MWRPCGRILDWLMNPLVRLLTSRRSWHHSFQILVQDGSKILDRTYKSCLFSEESCRQSLGWQVKICLFRQESCILENQVKFLLWSQEMDSCLMFKIKKNLDWSSKKVKNLERMMTRTSISAITGQSMMLSQCSTY